MRLHLPSLVRHRPRSNPRAPSLVSAPKQRSSHVLSLPEPVGRIRHILLLVQARHPVRLGNSAATDATGHNCRRLCPGESWRRNLLPEAPRP